MRIAIVAPPFGLVGGPEIMVRNLTRNLMALGVNVTLFAPSDWPSLGVSHISTLPQSLWNMPGFRQQNQWVRRNLHMAAQTKVLSYQDEFDLIHLHVPRFAYAVSAAAKIPTLLSAHNRIPADEFYQLQETGLAIVAMSHAQAEDLPYTEVIWNGLQLDEIEPSFTAGSSLLTIGRLTDQKGIHRAIEIAKIVQKKLIIIGRIGHGAERNEYFSEQIQPHIDGVNVIHIEKVAHEKIYAYMREASFLLFPIIRPESFGLVAAESLSCGTPVLGSTIAPLPEILGPAVEKGAAFLSNNIDDLAEMAQHPERFDRRACRTYAEENFDSSVMAKKYLSLYKKILNS